MKLTALTIGESVPQPDFDAAVHSVFRAALNLRLNDAPALLTLTTASQPDLPQGIRLDTPPAFSFETLRLAEPAACRDGILRLASLTVDLRSASLWTCNLPALRPNLTHPKTTAAWQSVWRALNARQRQTNADILAEAILSDTPAAAASRSPLARLAAAPLRRLCLSARQLDPSAALPALTALIGLGAGLTPSGDDLLVGFLAGLWCTLLDDRERLAFLTQLRESVIALSPRTNDISRTYLIHAAHGKVSSRLKDLAECLARGAPADHLLAAAEAAMQVGHTSGMDAVTGLLIGLMVWTNEALPPAMFDAFPANSLFQ